MKNPNAQRMLGIAETHLDSANFHETSSWVFVFIAVLCDEFGEDPFDMGFF